MVATETIEFRVIGEQRDDCGHLVLLGTDGHLYDYAICRNELVPIEPDDTWRFDPVPVGDSSLHIPSAEGDAP